MRISCCVAACPIDWERTFPPKFEKEDRPRVLREEFLALRFLAFIRYSLLHLRNQLTYIVAGFVLITLSLGFYPFSAPNSLAWGLAVAFACIGIPLIRVFLQIDRNAILSRLTNSDIGAVEKHFFFRIASFGALPLLSILGSHFPAISQFLFAWVRPLMRSFN